MLSENNGSIYAIFPAPTVKGHTLNLYKVSRLDMGAYMCIASNGVPPAVSKRIQLGIDCKFKIPTKLHFQIYF